MPAPTYHSGRIDPLLEIRLYDAGAPSDPVVTDHGYAWWDLLSESCEAGYGSSSRDSNGEFCLEYLGRDRTGGKTVGLVCRPFLALKETRLSQFTTSGGSWEERYQGTGTPHTRRLAQTDSAANLQWSARSSYKLPVNPSVCFSLFQPDTPADHDADTYPPFARLEFGERSATGQAQWALDYSKQQGARLLQWDGTLGAFQVVQEIHGRGREQNDLDETLIYLRCLRGMILVSTDRGRSYTAFQEPDGSRILVEKSQFTLRGQGGQAVFGVHQMLYKSGTYRSQNRNTFTSRLAPVPTFTAEGFDPNNPAVIGGGAGIAFTDASAATAGIAGYTATLTPLAIAGVPFTFYSTPELYTTTFRYPVETAIADSSYTVPWGNNDDVARITHCHVTKPYELDQATASWTVQFDPGSSFTGNYRWRKVQVRMGLAQDGEETWWTVFTGYIRRVTPSRQDYGSIRVTFEAESVAARFRRTEWTAFDVCALASRFTGSAPNVTLNEALDYILASEGLTSGYRSWDGRGALFVLPAGRSPEEPFELLRPGEKKWETMQRLCGYANLELGILESVDDPDAGPLFTTIPKQFVAGSSSFEYHAKTPSDVQQVLQSVSMPVDYGESCTAAIVRGTGPDGGEVLGWAVDTEAESNAASGRYCPWRELYQEDLRDPCTPGLLALRVQALAQEGFPLKYEPEMTAFLNLGLSRRDRVTVYGCEEAGITDSTDFVILTLEHEMGIGESGEMTLETRAGLRQLAI